MFLYVNPSPISCNGGVTPKVQTPIQSVLDFVPTAFSIVRRLLKRDIVKAILVAPPHAVALPPNRKTLISRFPIDNFWPKFADR